MNEGAAPEIALTSPADLAVITDLTEILGQVESPLLDRWTLSYRFIGQGGWIQLAMSRAPVLAGGTLATLSAGRWLANPGHVWPVGPAVLRRPGDEESLDDGSARRPRGLPISAGPEGSRNDHRRLHRQSRLRMGRWPLARNTLEILGQDEVLFLNNSNEGLDRETQELYVPGDVKLTTRDGRIFHLDLQDAVTHVEDVNGNTLPLRQDSLHPVPPTLPPRGQAGSLIRPPAAC